MGIANRFQCRAKRRVVMLRRWVPVAAERSAVSVMRGRERGTSARARPQVVFVREGAPVAQPFSHQQAGGDDAVGAPRVVWPDRLKAAGEVDPAVELAG